MTPVTADIVVARAISLLTPNRRWREDAAVFVADARDVLRSPDHCRRQLRTMTDFGVRPPDPPAPLDAIDRLAVRVERHGVDGLEAADLALIFGDPDLLLNVAARLHPDHRQAFEAAAVDEDTHSDDPSAWTEEAPARRIRSRERLVIPWPMALVAAVLLVVCSVTVTLWVAGPGTTTTTTATDDDSDGGTDDAGVAPATGGNGSFVFDDRAALASSDPEVRALAASRLARRGELDTRVFGALIDASSPDQPDGPLLLMTFGGLDGATAADIPALLDAIESRPHLPPEVAWMFALSMPDDAGFRGLIDIANRPDDSVHRRIARAAIDAGLLFTEEPPHDWRYPFRMPESWEMLLETVPGEPIPFPPGMGPFDGPPPPDGYPGERDGGWRDDHRHWTDDHR